MQKISYSALQTFRTCPLQYKFAYVDKIPSEQTFSMHYGTLLHEIMELLYAHSLLPPSKEDLAHVLSTNWMSRLYKGDQVREKHDFAEAMAIIEREWQKKQARGQLLTVGLEKRFSFPVAAEFAMTGRIDRIDKIAEDTLEIIDYKTGHNVPSVPDLKNNLQLAIYFLALESLWPQIEKVKLTLHFLRPDMQVSFEPETGFKEQALAKIEEIVLEIKASTFEAMPGRHCDHCPFHAQCPMMRHKYASQEVQVSGKELADAYMQLLAEKKLVEDKVAVAKLSLEAFLTNANLVQVFGTDGQIRKSTSITNRLDTAKVKTFLKEQNVLADFMQAVPMSRLLVTKRLPDIEDLA